MSIRTGLEAGCNPDRGISVGKIDYSPVQSDFSTTTRFTGGTVILENSLLPGGCVAVSGGRIISVTAAPPEEEQADRIDLQGSYLAPGFIDLHVHGGRLQVDGCRPTRTPGDAAPDGCPAP